MSSSRTYYFWAENLRKISIIPVLVSGITIYTGYYFLFVRRKPKIFTKSGKFRSFLTEHCSVLNQSFRPTFWAFTTRLQTVLASRLKSSPSVIYKSEVIGTKDGGVLQLDWAEPLPSFPVNQNSIVVILPGLTGTSQSNYVLHLVKQAQDKRFQVVVMNNRGLGGTRVRTAKAFCAANSDDFELVVSHIASCHPQASIFAIGTSLGGMILTNYLVRKGIANENTNLAAAMVVSVPWDVFKGTSSLESTLNYYLFNRYLTNKLIELCRENYNHLISNYTNIHIPFDVHCVERSKSIQEFDESFIAPMFGFKNAQEYYEAATLITKPLHKINTPLLCLNAVDDVFSPLDDRVISVMSQCSLIAMVTTTHGGHVAFLDSLFPTGPSFMDKLFGQFVEAARDNTNKLI